VNERKNSVTPVAVVACLAVFFFGIVLSLDSPSDATVRISFLAHRAALQDTMRLLERSGCPQSSRESVRNVVERYFAKDFEFDFSQFPKPDTGFYSFKNSAELVAALPHRPCDTQHDYEINCFDTVILLAGNGVRLNLKPDETAGPFLVSSSTNYETILVADTTRAAFLELCPTWYTEATEALIPSSLRDTRINLNASFSRWHKLPSSTNERTLQDNVMNTLRESWQRQDLKFPAQMEIVLCHRVNLEKLVFNTDHAGVLIPRRNGYTYFEKAGGSGPFVRLDFDSRADLVPWLRAMYELYKGPRGAYTNFFVTFNDSRIENLDVRIRE